LIKSIKTGFILAKDKQICKRNKLILVRSPKTQLSVKLIKLPDRAIKQATKKLVIQIIWLPGEETTGKSTTNKFKYI